DSDKVGSVEDGIFDAATGQFRYLVVDTGVWIFGKKVLLPIGRARFDNDAQRIYVTGLTKEQVENLPEYQGIDAIDYDYEENVRGVYRESTASQSIPVDGTAAYTRDTYNYDYDPELYTRDHVREENQPIRLYEERLVADKNRIKTGDVVVGKQVKSETANVSIPVEKERVVIERSTPTEAATTTANHAFNEGEVARVEVYEDRANVRKEVVLHEEVAVRKESEQDMVSKQATVRREELEIRADDDTVVVDK
ncbi:MAG: DUF2382 domain-containing protein, partial [Phormidesmis sp. RL_2_1]|nr:DUF2382 domain-containing protein [Phormidesmis sp. RL_2_1]